MDQETYSLILYGIGGLTLAFWLSIIAVSGRWDESNRRPVGSRLTMILFAGFIISALSGIGLLTVKTSPQFVLYDDTRHSSVVQKTAAKPDSKQPLKAMGPKARREAREARWAAIDEARSSND